MVVVPNPKLEALFVEDLLQETSPPLYWNPESGHEGLGRLIQERREKAFGIVAGLIGAGELHSSYDCLHAGMVLLRAGKLEDLFLAAYLGKRAKELDYPELGSFPPPVDAYLHAVGLSQWYGSRVFFGKIIEPWDRDMVTDDERLYWGIRSSAITSGNSTMVPIPTDRFWVKKPLEGLNLTDAKECLEAALRLDDGTTERLLLSHLMALRAIRLKPDLSLAYGLYDATEKRYLEWVVSTAG